MTLFFPTWLRVVSRCSLALAIFLMIGGEWTLLQAIAYGRMIYTYSSASSLPLAIEKTFSGRHPCSLCKKISMERKKTTKHDASIEKTTKKGDLFLTVNSMLVDPTFSLYEHPTYDGASYREPTFEVPEHPPQLLS